MNKTGFRFAKTKTLYIIRYTLSVIRYTLFIMLLLNTNQIEQKTKRLAIEILEENYGEREIILAGINNTGTRFAQRLKGELEQLCSSKIRLTTIRLNPANPLSDDITIDLPTKKLQNKLVLVIDDVANTGRTLYYAMKPIMEVLPKKVEVVVLVDRKHKSFPVKTDYVGMSLATTMQENIKVKMGEDIEEAVYLE